MTGFYLVHGEPPCCETDGPPGAAHLAAGLRRAGIPCRVVTDRPSVGAVKAALGATDLPGDNPLDVASVVTGDNGTPIEDIHAAWRGLERPLTHVVAIERIGPAADGVPYNAHGVDMSPYNAPLERLFTGGPWTTIGIGDGGNELGMGSIPRAVIEEHVRNCARIACAVPADHPMVCGVSNWGAIGILAALALLRPALGPRLLQGLTRDADHQILEACVQRGPAVSVPTWHKWPHVPVQCMAVDGVPWELHADLLEAVVALARP